MAVTKNIAKVLRIFNEYQSKAKGILIQMQSIVLRIISKGNSRNSMVGLTVMMLGVVVYNVQYNRNCVPDLLTRMRINYWTGAGITNKCLNPKYEYACDREDAQNPCSKCSIGSNICCRKPKTLPEQNRALRKCDKYRMIKVANHKLN